MDFMNLVFWNLISVIYIQRGICDANPKVKLVQKRSGQSARLVCHLKPKLKSNQRTHWFFSSSRKSGSEKLYKGVSGRVRISQEYRDETMLVFDSTQPNDAGFYLFKEMRHQGRELCVFKLDILIQAHANCGLSTEVVREQDTATLRCTGGGNPAPTLSWYRKTMDGKHRENITITGNKLIMRNVSRYASGVYECHAVNEVGSHHCEVYLNVHFLPVIDVYEDKITIAEKRDITLICRVTGNPSSEIIWSKGNSTDRIRSNPKYTIKEDRELQKSHMTTYSLLTLRSHKLGETMFDVYWCSILGFGDNYRQKVQVIDVSKNKTTRKPP